MLKFYKFVLVFLVLSFQINTFAQTNNGLFNAQYHTNNKMPWYAEFKSQMYNLEEFWQWFNSNYPSYQKFTFQIETDKTDELGYRHIRYHQHLGGYKVNHSAIIIHLMNNKVESFNTDIFDFTAPIYDKSIPKNTLQIAVNYYKTAKENVENETPEILWAKSNIGTQQEQFYLCDAYRINVEEGITHDKIYIDRHNGKIILKENLITHVDTINRAKTFYRGVRYFTADYTRNDSFRLRETGKRLISTFRQSNNNDFWNVGNNWRDSSLATNDIHWGTEVVMDMLKKRFNVNSFDNKGTLLYNLSQPGSSGNAYWTLGGNVVNYFTGTSGSVTPCAALDIVGHELGHGVADGVAGLVYSGESGALHESFGDIQGYVAERTGDSTKYDWIVGDQVWVGGIRNMRRPKAFNNPNTYNGQYWGGGFHSNGGVQNHFFYTLAVGDTATNDNNYSYAIKGIGYDNAVKVKFRSYLNYVTPNTTFAMMASFDVKSARDLFGSCGQEVLITKECWKAAGIIDTTNVVDLSHAIVATKLHCGTNNKTVTLASIGDISRKCTWFYSQTDSTIAKTTSKNFTSSGTYTVRLKTEVCGKKFWDTTQITLSLNPIAKLKSMNPLYCQSNDSLTIVNNSTNTEPTLTLKYQWIVGPFNNYSIDSKNIKIPKDIAADYYVELKAYYDNGCQDTTALKYTIIENTKPSFTVKNVCPCQNMQLKNTTITNGGTYTYLWQFDDTTSKAGFQPVKSYCRAGKHSVILNSTNTLTGCKDSAMRYVTIFERPKVAIGITSFCYGDSARIFDNTTHDKKIQYNQWYLNGYNPQNATNVVYPLTDSGEQTLTLEVYDEIGCENSTSIKLKPEVLNVNFTANSFCENSFTNFNAKINNQKPLTEYYWVINNVKKYINELNPKEKFTAQTVDVSFWAKSAQCKAQADKKIEIYEVPKAAFAVEDEKCSGDSFTFKNNSIYTLPVAHEWQFSNNETSSQKEFKKAWVNANTNSYTVCLKEKNNFGCADSICKIITVNENPNCNFNIENYWINYNGRGYKFVVPQNNTSYEWDFGDGNKASSNNISHQYTNDGQYKIKLKLKNNAGCICETTKTLSVLKSNISNILASQIKIFPNPSLGILNIKGLNSQIYTYQLLTLDGKIVKQNSFTGAISENIEGLSKGIYLLKIKDDTNEFITKIEVL